ncbi:MAG: molybdenum cofactor biosynthesis protein MoaE [Spirochaetaceae bacterium]|nr:MAG: molybdenum cofactor biosynthesis protein MoaE [Spirochaetaceae bacterium]
MTEQEFQSLPEVLIESEDLFVEGSVNPALIADITDRWSTERSIGAHTVFLGRVRADRHEEGTVSAIEFTTHREMAEKALRNLMIRVAGEHATDRTLLFVQHGLGVIPVGGIPVAVCVATGHRGQAFAICSGILEALKSEVPIYGKELFDNAGHRWKVNR